MVHRLEKNRKMVQALTILSALQLFSEGLPGVEGSGEPYGISRGVVQGAALAGSQFTPQNPREFILNPDVPALSQVAPSSLQPTASNSILNGPISTLGEARKPDMPQCSFGKGVVRYERLPDVQLVRSTPDADIVRLSEIPADVVFKCEDLCLKDRTAQSIPQPCGSFDFVPGKRFTSKIEYTESKCFLAMPSQTPGNHLQLKAAKDYYHYREVCFAGTEGSEQPRAATECPERLYVAERLMNKRFMPKEIREVNAKSLEMCQQMCLNQATEDPLKATSICRSGTFDHQTSRCYLSTYTRRTHPQELIDDTNYDYFENTCLDVERRCPEGKLFWTKEVNAEMIGPYDFLIHQNLTMDECKSKCLNNANIFCRSIEYDEKAKICVLSDEDSVSKPQDIRKSFSDQNIYLELTCIDGYNVETNNLLSSRANFNPDRQPLSDRNVLDVKTAFQLFRNRRLDLSPGFQERGRTGTRVSLAECLDQCLEETEFRCHSVIYSSTLESCKLSEYDRLNGNLVMDQQYDYFENLMSGSQRFDSTIRGSRPSSFDGIPGNFRPLNLDNNRFKINSRNRFFGDGNRGTNFESSGGFDNTLASRNRFRDQNQNRNNEGFGIRNEDRFSEAFNRFRETNLNRPVSNNDFASGNRFAGSTRGQFGSTDRFSGTLGSRGSGGSRITGADRFAGGTSGRFSGGSRNIGLFNSGADINSLRGTGGGSRLSDSSRFSEGSTSSFGFGSSSSSSKFGSSSSGSGFDSFSGFGSGAGAPDLTRPGSGISDEYSQVSQQCNPDGSMEFMLRTADPFRGRIYTFGYYDKCFYRGGGSTVNVLNISPARGFPNCGTLKYGDTTTNIVVVQFADGVMTSRDKRYNLTCTTIGPGDAVVTSAYIGAGMGAPIPIQYISDESRLDSQVRLQILYAGRPTATVAVGDPLTFRIESLAGRGLVSDIFATDVIARDVLTGRAIQLIDSRGCPVQEEIFPALGRARSGDGLETQFSAFKIPESNMIVFEARVRMCRSQCEPAICNMGRGRSEVYSYGKRKKRSASKSDSQVVTLSANESTSPEDHYYEDSLDYGYDDSNDLDDESVKINEVIRVYMNEEEASEHRSVETAELRESVCAAPSGYYSLLAGLLVTSLLLLSSLFSLALCYRKYKTIEEKNKTADQSNPRQSQRRSGFPGAHPRTVNQPARQVYFPTLTGEAQSNNPHNSQKKVSGGRFNDPSEPIYTDPTLFERSTNLMELSSKNQ